jgi:hypothetical protein
MKTTLLLLTAASVATAFVTPFMSTSTRAPTTLYKATAVEEEVAAGVGAKDISGLTSGVKTVYTSEDIDKLLPHRYPFALVDRVVEYEAGKVSVYLYSYTGKSLNFIISIGSFISFCTLVLTLVECCRHQTSDQE